MEDRKQALSTCPMCGSPLTVRALGCPGCGTEVHGAFDLPRLARLPRELQDFVETFLRSRGNIREVERVLGISYPTVSKKLDAVNLLLQAMGEREAGPRRALRQLEAGEIDVNEALKRLRESSEEEA